MSDEVVLSEQSAQKELERILEYYEMDFEEAGEEAQKGIEGSKNRIIKGFQRGKFEIEECEEDGFCIIQHTKKGGRLRYKEIDGNAKTAMSSFKENDHHGQCYGLLGSLSGEGHAVIKKLRGPDLKRAEALGLILLFA